MWTVFLTRKMSQSDYEVLIFWNFLSQDKTTSEAIEDELGLAGAAEEDADAEFIRKVCDVEIVTGKYMCSWWHVYCIYSPLSTLRL